MRTPPQGRASAPVHFYVFTLTTRKCNHRMNKTTHHYTEAGPRRGRHSGATRLLTRLSACAGRAIQSDGEKHHDQTKNHPDHEGNTGMTLHTKARRAALALALAAGMIPGLASAAPVSCEHWNTLAFFIRAGAADVARCLKTKDANARDAAGLTPMHRAAGFGRTPALVRTLAKADAQPNARDVNGMTPLHLAVNFNRNPAVVTALIKPPGPKSKRENSAGGRRSTSRRPSARRPPWCARSRKRERRWTRRRASDARRSIWPRRGVRPKPWPRS